MAVPSPQRNRCDFSFEMDICSEGMKGEGEDNDRFDYTVIIRKSSFWRIKPLENIDLSNVSATLQSSSLDSYNEFWQDKIVDSDAEEEIFTRLQYVRSMTMIKLVQ